MASHPVNLKGAWCIQGGQTTGKEFFSFTSHTPLQEATIIHADYDGMHFTPDSFIYVDPPYKGSFDKYVSDGFDHDRFKEWAECIGSRHKVMISYSDDEFSGYNKHEFSGIRSMGRERTTEYVYTSY